VRAMVADMAMHAMEQEAGLELMETLTRSAHTVSSNSSGRSGSSSIACKQLVRWLLLRPVVLCCVVRVVVLRIRMCTYM
jgi:hypothetical protein